jgi:glycosyltransferase involved in cell wall biosynthesis
MINIHIILETGADGKPFGCGHIRLLRPFDHLAQAGLCQFTAGSDYRPADVVIVDRMWRCDATLHDAYELVAKIRRDKTPLVYSLDDNLLDLDRYTGYRHSLRDEQRMLVRFFAREAGLVLVSTPQLAERMKPLNPNIAIVPNNLDERLFPRDARGPVPHHGSGRARVGYMGTFTHEADFLMVLEALRSFSDRIEMEIVGAIADPAILKGALPLQIHPLSTHGNVDYPHFATWMARSLHWDFAIAPLEDDVFTRCKSDIKFLDYALCGVPGIFSDVEAYRHSVLHGETGLLAANTVESWRTAIASYLDDAPRRTAIAQNAEEFVRNNRTLAQTARLWLDAADSARNRG